jgi:hypothetical protein
MILVELTDLVVFSFLSRRTNDLIVSLPHNHGRRIRTHGCQTTTSISDDTSSPRRKEPMISKLTIKSVLHPGTTNTLTIRYCILEGLVKEISEHLDFFSGNHQFHLLVIVDCELLSVLYTRPTHFLRFSNLAPILLLLGRE